MHICIMQTLLSSSPSSTTAPAILESRVSITTSSIPLLHCKIPINPFLFLFLCLLSFPFPFRASSVHISYADHCGSFVPESSPSGLPSDSDASFRISNGYFFNRDRLIGQDHGADYPFSRSFTFYTRSVLHTQTKSTLQVVGTLIFRGGDLFARRNITSRGRSLRLVRPLNPRSIGQRGRVSFDLSGFWSQETGKLCMLGTGTGRSSQGISHDFSAVFKFRYPSSSDITSSVVSGILESLETVNSPNYFDRISLLAYVQRNYEFTKINQAQTSCSDLRDSVDPTVGLLNRRQSICDAPRDFLSTRFKLDYRSNCSDRNCGPFSLSSGSRPSFLKFTSLDCSDDGRVRLVVLFSNFNGLSSFLMLEPGMAMVAEGSWDQTTNQLCVVACRVKTFTDALSDSVVDDCTIGLSLAFPAVFTIESRSTTVGRIWSNLIETIPGHFNSVLFRSFWHNRGEYHNELTYKYTKLDAVRKSCTGGDVPKSGKKRYPDPRNFRDFMFYLTMTMPDGKQESCFANPLALGETIHSYPSTTPPALVEWGNESTWNISYSLTQINRKNSPFRDTDSADISAEGIYIARTGSICMVGCRSSSSDKQGNIVDSKDCSILIYIQMPSLNPEPGEHLHGMIKSMRPSWDPIFFKPLEISSRVMYGGQAAESVWRMDIEITMILISLTFSCIFVGLQLLHVNKHPRVLPSISVTMLVFLTLGHMIVLVLNFEAFLRNKKKQNVLQGGGSWLEVNEVVVRLMTMVAFMLHVRLLQVTWSARSAHEGANGFWLSERRTIRLCLLIYIVGGCIAWLVRPKTHKNLHHVPHKTVETSHSHWDDMQSYAGLILDGFLFPQLILNVLCDLKEASLTPPFYIGTTILRALPHAYDVYRSSHFAPLFDSSYIYARPNGDLYSLAWDIVIPCGGFLFAVGIYIQQRFGGAFIFCRKISSPGFYEMVPVAIS